MKRFEWLNMMIKKYNFRIGAEIGTGRGKTGMELLSNNENLHLVQVVYYPKDYTLSDASPKAERMWKRRVLQRYFNRITVLRGKSHDVHSYVTNNSLDFIFIDADHLYENCLEDILDWTPKVKKGGLISGHDYDSNSYPGVVRAVNECFKNYNLEDDRVWFTWKA